jgi:hypothetical protein
MIIKDLIQIYALRKLEQKIVSLSHKRDILRQELQFKGLLPFVEMNDEVDIATNDAVTISAFAEKENVIVEANELIEDDIEPVRKQVRVVAINDESDVMIQVGCELTNVPYNESCKLLVPGCSVDIVIYDDGNYYFENIQAKENVA